MSFFKVGIAALLVAATFSASAQSNVVLYGIVDAALVRTDPASGTATTELFSGLQSGSRWGFRGREDLGGGLSADMQLEGGFNTDTGQLGQGGRLFGRLAWVGLSGGFGQVRAGRFNLAGHDLADYISPFGVVYADAGVNRAVATSSTILRVDNLVMYTTPKMAGFEGKLGYSFRHDGIEVAGNSNNTNVLTASGTVSLGALFAGVSHEAINCPASTTTPATGTCSLASKNDQKHTMAGVAYDLKFVVLRALYSIEKNVFVSPAVTSSPDSRGYLLGLTAPLGKGELKLSFQERDDKSTADADLQIWAIGYQYDLSRRTSLAVFFVSTDNENNVAALTARDRKQYGGGLRHRF